ncbi:MULTISPECIES: hypothetical protein [unclassified Paenibacillus]|uniref:hypothetical protein n=1 Tax=unclassified Paenibacillus TaxID=185978 RepID=UPI00048FF696|nr:MULTISPECIES: hypothetical protein [unclassified Paenibacillus]
MDREKWDNPVNQIRPLNQSRETGKVTLVYEKEHVKSGRKKHVRQMPRAMMDREELLLLRCSFMQLLSAHIVNAQLLAYGQGVFLYLRTLSINSPVLTRVRVGKRKETKSK